MPQQQNPTPTPEKPEAPKAPPVKAAHKEDGSPDFEAMFDAMAQGLLNTLATYLDDRMQPLEEALTAPPADPTNPEDPADPVDPKDPMAARLAALEKELADQKEATAAKEREADEAAFAKLLSDAIGSHGPRPEVAQATTDLLAARLKDFKKTETGWLSPDGKTVQESVGAFFGTDEGKAFLPPKGSPGAPVDRGTSSPPGGKTDITLADAIKAF